MQNVRKLTADLYWMGGSDRRLSLFENVYPIPRGISYNSYLLMDEKTALLDTIDAALAGRFLENVEAQLGQRTLDYVVIHHMEPDHAALLAELAQRYPAMQLVCSAQALKMLGQFFGQDFAARTQVVKEGDTLCTGRHTLHFVAAPMVHWPEVLMSYDEADKILFSADAFGTFGALNGNLYADELNFERDWLDDARRYYSNIVGKYGAQVQAVLKKAATLDVALLCPLHGPIWRDNISWFVQKYDLWSRYEPEERAVLIAYASIYGNTENAAELLAGDLAEKGVRNIAMYDVSGTDPSVVLSEAFRCSHLVLASPTYNGGIFPKMETVLLEMKAHALQGRRVALLDNGSWAPTAGKQMAAVLGEMKNMELLAEPVHIQSGVQQAQRGQIAALAETLAADVLA